jgi:hypothetical protein
VSVDKLAGETHENVCWGALESAIMALIGLENCIKAGSPAEVLSRFVVESREAVELAQKEFDLAIMEALEVDE